MTKAELEARLDDESQRKTEAIRQSVDNQRRYLDCSAESARLESELVRERSRVGAVGQLIGFFLTLRNRIR